MADERFGHWTRSSAEALLRQGYGGFFDLGEGGLAKSVKLI